MNEVGSNGLEIDEDIVKLLQNEEATGHALTTWDSITLRGRGTDHLEEVLGDAHVILLVAFLTDDSVYNGLEDVFLGEDTLHILNESISFLDISILQVVND